jgi:hypothetical protein
MRFVVGCLAVVGALTACTELPQTAAEPTVAPSCTMNEVAGIVLFIVDSTDGPFRGPVATTLRDGAFSQTIAFPATYGLDHRYLAYERPGTYSITLEAPGYKTWRRDNVVVTSERCHVKPVSVTALMQR